MYQLTFRQKTLDGFPQQWEAHLTKSFRYIKFHNILYLNKTLPYFHPSTHTLIVAEESVRPQHRSQFDCLQKPVPSRSVVCLRAPSLPTSSYRRPRNGDGNFRRRAGQSEPPQVQPASTELSSRTCSILGQQEYIDEGNCTIVSNRSTM
jgi:hypothetical protein